MGDTQQPKLYLDDLLVGDPRWMMYPGEGYEYVSLKSGYTGVKNRNGKLFSIETDGLVIVRLWPVIADNLKLQLDTLTPLYPQEEVLRPIEPRLLRRRPKVDDVALSRWSSPKALETRSEHHEIFEVGIELQGAALRYLYERESTRVGKKFKPSQTYCETVEAAVSKLAKVLANHNPDSTSFVQCLSEAGEMFSRIASDKSVYPKQPGPNLRVALAYVLGVARSRRRVVRSATVLHNAMEFAVAKRSAATALATRFNPSLTGVSPMINRVPKYNKFTELLSTMLDDVEGASFYFHDGRSTILDPDVPFQKAS